MDDTDAGIEISPRCPVQVGLSGGAIAAITATIDRLFEDTDGFTVTFVVKAGDRFYERKLSDVAKRGIRSTIPDKKKAEDNNQNNPVEEIRKKLEEER